MQGPQGPATPHARASRPSHLLCQGRQTRAWQFLWALLLLLLLADRFPDDWLIHAPGADTIAACPAMPPGTMPLTPPTLPMHPARRLPLAPSDRLGPTARGRPAETQGPMRGHRVAFDQFAAWLLAEVPEAPPDAAAQLPREHPTSGLWDENKVILAIPADVRWALPVSHENLLPSDRGGSLQGGWLLQFYARRNGRASASLTARGGGLPVGVKEQIVEMALNARGIRDTARVLHVSTNTIMTE